MEMEEVNEILRGSWTTEGVLKWWHRKRFQIDYKTPLEVWETDPQRVYDLALAGRDMGGT